MINILEHGSVYQTTRLVEVNHTNTERKIEWTRPRIGCSLDDGREATDWNPAITRQNIAQKDQDHQESANPLVQYVYEPGGISDTPGLEYNKN